jgi:hypothetical protein
VSDKVYGCLFDCLTLYAFIMWIRNGRWRFSSYIR